MIHHRLSILFLPIFLLLPPLTSPGQAAQQIETSPTQKNAVWAWADNAGSRHAIFISRQTGTEWEEPVQISNNEGVNVVPSVTKTAATDLFVVWSTFGGQQAQLRYRQCKKGVWAEEKEYYTGLSSNTSPSVSIDKSGKVWLVWAGFNGLSDEIYYSTWNGNGFETAQPLTANDIPDIQPILGMDEATGQPWVQWQQFSDKGYIELEAIWNGSAWSAPVEVAAPEATTEATTAATTAVSETTSTYLRTLSLKKAGPARTAEKSSQAAEATGETATDLEIKIPTFIKYPESASVHVPGYAVQSLPVRRVAPVK